MSLHFLHLWTIGEKNDVQILKRCSIYLITTQNIIKTCEGQRLYILLDKTSNTKSFKNLNVVFFTNGP